MSFSNTRVLKNTLITVLMLSKLFQQSDQFDDQVQTTALGFNNLLKYLSC